MARDALHLTVTGQVQGVGYRWWTVGTARAMGVEGWVRNRRDGSVEILAIGRPGLLTAFGAACARGPAAARVASVARGPATDDGSRGFTQKATA